MFPYLKDEIAIIIPDLPGHGNSEGRASTELTDYLDIITLLAKELNREHFFLGGHSMGGAISLLYALQHPEKADGLLIYASSSALPVNPRLLEMLKQNFDMLTSLSVQFSFARADEEIQFFKKMVKEMTKENGPDTLYNDMVACDNYDIGDRIPSINIPITLFAGEKDKMVSLDNIRNFYQRLSTKKNLSILPDTGHMLILEEPEKVARESLDFVRSLSTK